jgi:hypothetical protein
VYSFSEKVLRKSTATSVLVFRMNLLVGHTVRIAIFLVDFHSLHCVCCYGKIFLHTIKVVETIFKVIVWNKLKNYTQYLLIIFRKVFK